MDNFKKYALLKKRLKKLIKNKGLRKKVLKAVVDICIFEEEDIDMTRHDEHGRVELEEND